MHKRPFLPRLGAMLLILALLLTPAQALTVDQARELLTLNYVDPIPQEILDLPTVDDILDALGDPYTEYMDAHEYALFLSSMADDSTGGIGIVARMTDEGFLIDEVTENGPAQAAGLRAGDCIVAVDGVDIQGIEADRAVALIRGPEGSEVTITYLRRGSRRTVRLTRDVTLVIPATDGWLLEGDVGYIACETWGLDTADQFQTLIEELDDQVGCWLIDLRGNTGGYTDAASDVAGLFCGGGPKAYLRMRDESQDDGYAYDFYGDWEAAITDKPAVILVDGSTASASEIFTAAMMDYGRAVTVGGRTFGKGVAQGLWDQNNLPDYFPEGDGFKITAARVYSPLLNTPDVIGHIPRFPAAAEDTEAVGYTLAQLMAQAGEQWPQEVSELLIELVEANGTFEDVSEDHPYAGAIATLATYGLVQGDENGLYHPQDTLTRAQLAQILQNTMAYPWATDATFDDVAEDAWYAQAAAAVADMGLMTGVGDGRFAPDQTLTRQELFTAVARLGRRLNDDLDITARTMDPEEVMGLWVLREYDDWAKEGVWLLSCALEDDNSTLINLLWAYPEDIDPTAPATRAEAAEALYTLLCYLDILP